MTIDSFSVDFRNGHPSFPESDDLMRLLLGYEEIPDYHPIDGVLPFMVPTPKWVKPKTNGRVSAFPGGPGTAPDAERFPKYGILVMAHDFDSLQSYLAAVSDGYDAVEDQTFRDLCKMFKQGTNSEFDLRECFFTNRFMGVRKVVEDHQTEPKNAQSGQNPSRKFIEYEKMCETVFRKTLGLVEPSLVIAVGEPASTSLKHGKKHWHLRGVNAVNIFGHETSLVCLTHPGSGFYSQNVERVEYRDYDGEVHIGHDAQLTLIRDAWHTYKRVKARR